jgi:hypothetical protein
MSKIKKPKIVPKIFTLIIISIVSITSLLGQGPGGPAALQNAFSGGPPPPPGGGGGGEPIAVPLDSNALFILLFAGVVYLLYHYRKAFLQNEISENADSPTAQTIITSQ